MKKILCLILAAVMTLSLGACSKGDVSKVYIPDWKPSEIYTDEEIEAAFQVVKEYFQANFTGCTLTRLSYVGDTSADEFREWAAQRHADEAIILSSSFDVDASGGDGSLNPNSTYENWKWILVRDKGGAWKHADHGYA